MTDILQAGFEFASKVVKALNDAGIKEVKDMEPYCALMVVACPKTGEPIGFSLNFDFERGQWTLDGQATPSTPCDLEH